MSLKMAGLFANRSKKMKVVICSIVLITVGVALVNQYRSYYLLKHASDGKRVLKKEDLQIEKVTEDLSQDDREYFGQIMYYEKVSISSKVEGKLEKIYIKVGEVVKPDDVVAQIERLPLEITLKQQMAQLENAKISNELAIAKLDEAVKSIEIKFKTIEKARVDIQDKTTTFQASDRTLKNKEKLFAAGGVSETELKSAQTQQVSAYTRLQQAQVDLEIQQVGYRDNDIVTAGYPVPSSEKDKIEILKKINTRIERAEVDASLSQIKQIEANVESTKLLLKETTIRSPFMGLVASKNMDAGELVKADSVLAVLINIKDVYLVLNINEKDIESIRLHQKVNFVVDALANKTFNGEISNITPVLDEKTRTMEVKALVRNTTRQLLPGMFTRATINTGAKIKKIMIPVSALFDKKDKNAAVYVLKKNIVFRQDVELGKEYNNMIEIRNGLEKDEEIATASLNSLYPGMKLD